MEQYVSTIVENLKNVLSKEFIVLLLSMCPVLELRAGMIAAALLKIPYIKACLLCFLGNIIPIPFVLLLCSKVLNWMEGIKLTRKIALFFKNMAAKHKPFIDKYGFIGLVIFTGIPLPGSGAWTASLVSSVFHYDIKKASVAIIIGVILALIIMSIVSYGLIGTFFIK